MHSVGAPLHIAVRENNLEAAKLLLANGADPRIEARYGGGVFCAPINEVRSNAMLNIFNPYLNN
ncbi:MAG: hypothetical protein E3J72_19010 [Planctomycetota bacterium]|nr:MAG: hypothetical protein E3J72_19010 [Planctomycetota bacterium]